MFHSCVTTKPMDHHRISEDDINDSHQCNKDEISHLPTNDIHYDEKKPKWWKQVAGRKGTKAQRRAYQTMTFHRLSTVTFGQMYDFRTILGYQYVWLELGSGQGHVLLANAKNHPQIAMIGADIHQPGIGKTLMQIQLALKKSDNTTSITLPNLMDTEVKKNQVNFVTNLSIPYSNVRVYPGDGIKLIHAISDSSLSVILMTFPDPWSKRDTHHRYRLLQNHTLQQIHRVLLPNGRFYLATDDPILFESSLDLFTNNSSFFTLVTPCPPRSEWLPVVSKYEQKGWDEGRNTLMACWEKIIMS
jgi:tRNA G46 methylase TrmB